VSRAYKSQLLPLLINLNPTVLKATDTEIAGLGFRSLSVLYRVDKSRRTFLGFQSERDSFWTQLRYIIRVSMMQEACRAT
jgi:hypothetical protein